MNLGQIDATGDPAELTAGRSKTGQGSPSLHTRMGVCVTGTLPFGMSQKAWPLDLAVEGLTAKHGVRFS